MQNLKLNYLKQIKHKTACFWFLTCCYCKNAAFWGGVMWAKRWVALGSRWKTAALAGLGLLWRGQERDTFWLPAENESSHTLTHSGLTHPTDSTTQKQANTHTPKHVAVKFHHRYLTAQHRQPATNWGLHRITLSSAGGTKPPLCGGRKKNRGVWSAPAEVRGC